MQRPVKNEVLKETVQRGRFRENAKKKKLRKAWEENIFLAQR